MLTTIQQSQNRVFRTSSIYEGAYLLSLGFCFLGCEDLGTNYLSLMFENSPELEKAVMDFGNNGQVSVLTFTNSYKKLKSAIFSKGRNNNGI